MKSNALFSDDKKYRYKLTRIWNDQCPILGFILLNPSIADYNNNDPTTYRCIQYAAMNGYGGIHIYNLFGYIDSNPKVLKKVTNPIGEDNDYYLSLAKLECVTIIAGWGKYGKIKNRDAEVKKLFDRLYCLKINKDGTPAHPLYLSYNQQVILYKGKEE